MLHPLKKYLFLNEIKLQDFADKIDYSRINLSMLCSGKFGVSKRLGKAIEKETQGVVKASDLQEWYEFTKSQKTKVEQLNLFD